MDDEEKGRLHRAESGRTVNMAKSKTLLERDTGEPGLMFWIGPNSGAAD